jgi:uncharacterized protein (TIGR02246 family)
MRSRLLIASAGALALAACQGTKPAAFNPDDPAVVAAIDSIIGAAMEGAARADAEQVMSIAHGAGEFTFITGDILLEGDSSVLESFRATYRAVAKQENTISTRKVRLLAPDVALFTAVGEGTYTDKAGWTSPPVGLGLTLVFVRDASSGQWRAQHAHQSVVD